MQIRLPKQLLQPINSKRLMNRQHLTQAGVVPLKTNYTAALGPGRVLKATGSIIDPVANADHAFNHPGVAAAAATVRTEGIWVLTRDQTPAAADNLLARCTAAGVAAAEVADDDSRKFYHVDSLDGDSRLRAERGGSGQILWMDWAETQESGTKNAVVRVQNGYSCGTFQTRDGSTETVNLFATNDHITDLKQEPTTAMYPAQDRFAELYSDTRFVKVFRRGIYRVEFSTDAFLSDPGIDMFINVVRNTSPAVLGGTRASGRVFANTEKTYQALRHSYAATGYVEITDAPQYFAIEFNTNAGSGTLTIQSRALKIAFMATAF